MGADSDLTPLELAASSISQQLALAGLYNYDFLVE
jgi:hypothetical protein